MVNRSIHPRTSLMRGLQVPEALGTHETGKQYRGDGRHMLQHKQGDPRKGKKTICNTNEATCDLAARQTGKEESDLWMLEMQKGQCINQPPQRMARCIDHSATLRGRTTRAAGQLRRKQENVDSGIDRIRPRSYGGRRYCGQVRCKGGCIGTVANVGAGRTIGQGGRPVATGLADRAAYEKRREEAESHGVRGDQLYEDTTSGLEMLLVFVDQERLPLAAQDRGGVKQRRCNRRKGAKQSGTQPMATQGLTSRRAVVEESFLWVVFADQERLPLAAQGLGVCAANRLIQVARRRPLADRPACSTASTCPLPFAKRRSPPTVFTAVVARRWTEKMVCRKRFLCKVQGVGDCCWCEDPKTEF
ncbi:hypothetical protein BJ742DRAFT_737120 [Cladochytrium replicatum]|nr:hypothetical protein BJ742DRAFT_737120 [Cladochytrium replicatum]